jgi:hypothetical protein
VGRHHGRDLLVGLDLLAADAQRVGAAELLADLLGRGPGSEKLT